MSHAIEVEGLSHRFGRRHALQDISFAIPSGAFAALTGANGSGKSTLIALLANLYGVRQGRVRLLGHDITGDAPAALKRTGIVFQRPSLDLDLTVAENLAYHGALHGLSPEKAKATALDEMARQGLEARMDSRVRELSVGQRRRIEIGRALMTAPALLLLDEPTAALDREGRAALAARVKALQRERGATVLWASHHAEEVDDADMTLHLEQGRLA